jgi:hypothetical protein
VDVMFGVGVGKVRDKGKDATPERVVKARKLINGYMFQGHVSIM